MNCDDTFGPIVNGCRSFDFTLLWEQSILSIAPSAIFLLIVPWRLQSLIKGSTKTVPNLLAKATVTTSIALVVLQLALLVEWTRQPPTRTTIPAAVLSLFDALAILALTSASSRNVRPLSLLTLYLLLSIMFGAVELRTLYLRADSDAILGISTAILATKVCLFLLELPGKTRWLRTPYRKLSPEATQGVVGRSLFWWINPLMTAGFRRLLSIDDLYQTDPIMYSDPLAKRLQASWSKYSTSPKLPLLKATLDCFKWEIVSILIPRAFMIAFNYAQPFLITRAVEYVGQPVDETDRNDGYGLIGAAALIYIGIAISNTQFEHKLFRSLTMFRGGIVSLIYAQSLNLPTGIDDSSAALTLMSADIDRITMNFEQVVQLWAYVIEIAIGLYLLSRQVGWICVAPVVVVGLGIYLATLLSKHIMPSQKTWMEAIQKRIGIISPALNSMKAVKMMGLSTPLSSRLQALRVRELNLSASFRKFASMRIVIGDFPNIMGPFAVFTIFAIQAQVQGLSGIDPSKAFTALAIIRLLTSPAGNFASTIPTIGLARNCVERIEKYLLKEPWEDHQHAITLDTATLGSQNVTIALSVQDITLRLAKDAEPAIRGLTMQVSQGALVMVTGPVGCGKTSLLRAVLGDIDCESGIIQISRKEVGFCSERAWLPNGTIREIITGSKDVLDIDQQFYDTTIHACAFDVDINQLSEAHDTEIGTRGVVLSGGQKQRLALARAVYARKDILLLDDVLSALDHNTEELIIERLLGTNGLLRKLGTTVVLSGHAWRPMSLADKILVLNANGTLRAEGRLETLRKSGIINDDFIRVATSHESHASETPKDLPKVVKGPSANDIADLKRRTGDLSLYKYYASTIGVRISLVIVAAISGTALASYLPQILIKWYATGIVHNNGLFSGVYAILAVTALIATYLSTWSFYCLAIPKSGAQLHEVVLKATFDAPQSFHDKTDTGITLNRFSQDMSLLDNSLPVAALITLQAAANCLVLVGFISAGSSWMGLTLPFLLMSLYFLQKLYLRTSRQIRFLDLEAKAPLYGQFVESLEGLSTIRAFGWQSRFISSFHEKLDLSQRPYYLMFCIQRWLNLALGLMIGLMAVIVIALAVSVRNSTNAGSLGVALSSVLSLDLNFQYLMKFWTSLETSLGAIARIRDYERDTPSETALEGTHSPADSWPARGSIEFANMEARYSPIATRPALSIPNLLFPPSSKIGIIGRTGSGKSTLLSLLTGLIQPSTGSISIDNHSLSAIPVATLRERLVTIPQDAFIIPGLTVRENIDLTSTATDAQIITALQKVNLWTTLSTRGGLDASMPSLSAGESQVFALARALLRKEAIRSLHSSDGAVNERGGSGVLLLDEATSNTDAVTDERMSRVIAEEFAEWTLVCVAHRFETVRRLCETVVRLEGGKVVEVGEVGHIIADAASEEDERHGRGEGEAGGESIEV